MRQCARAGRRSVASYSSYVPTVVLLPVVRSLAGCWLAAWGAGHTTTPPAVAIHNKQTVTLTVSQLLSA